MSRNGQSDRIAPHLTGKAEDYGITVDNRLFVEAVLWMARTGAPLQDMSERFGHWNSVFKRIRRWVSKGVFKRLIETSAATNGEVSNSNRSENVAIARRPGTTILKSSSRLPSPAKASRCDPTTRPT